MPTPEPDTAQIPSLVDNRVIRPAQTALALELVNEMDLLRLKAIARVYARGLPPDPPLHRTLQDRLRLGTQAHAPYVDSRGVDMRTKVKTITSEVKLTRVLDAFAQELIDASDEEISAAAMDLGMDLQKWSSAFAGVTYPSRPQLADFFDLQALQARLAADKKP